VDTGSKSAAPEIEARWVFISTNREIQLAAIVASYLSDTNKYACFFEFPAVEYPYTGSSDFGTDGYISRINGDRAAVNIGNALAKIQPERIVLLRLTEIEKGYLTAHLPTEILIELDSAAQLQDQLGIVAPLEGEIRCKPDEVMRGLLKARFERKKLVIDDLAEPLPPSRLVGNSGLIAIEEDGDLHDLAAINLAYSCGVDVAFLPPTDKKGLFSLARDLNEWSRDRSHHAYQSWKRWTRAALRDIDLAPYRFATFFTTGLPYGLFISNPIPCSHVIKYLDAGVQILNAIALEHEPRLFGSALLFSPQLFASEEINDIRISCETAGLRVKELLGAEATVENLGNFGGYYPYDALHICSHGGETDGYFSQLKFQDRQGAEHIAEYYEVLGVGPVDAKGAMIHLKVIFHKLDGHRWMSEPLREFPHYVFEDMMKAIKADRGDAVIRTPHKFPIALSCHIQCHRSIHQGHFDHLAGLGNPIVFNNTCSSSHELAINFLSGGARGYVGTLWRVDNEEAKEAAIRFYQSLFQQHNVLVAFHEMLQSIHTPKYCNVYVYWGFHFSTLKQQSASEEQAILGTLMFLWHIWLKKVATTKDEVVKRNALPVLRFLTQQIIVDIHQKGISPPDEFDEETVSDIERSLPPAQERAPILEMSEVDMGDL
jgi:hypothetical protein